MSWDLDTLLPLIFAALMGLSILIYVLLDGFDLGVGVLSPWASDAERDVMVGSIGPFWDANETWLVMAVGLLLVAFPVAHGAILTALYLPATVMLIGLILRGVAFEFRAKAPVARKAAWDYTFFVGSLMASLCQGYMLGIYILGLEQSLAAALFGLLTAVCLTAAYAFLGALWLLGKTEGALQARSLVWARRSLAGVVAGLIAVSLASPLASPRIFEKWFDWPQVLWLAPAPVLTGALLWALWRALQAPKLDDDLRVWRPFQIAIGVFVLGFAGLAYSFYPYVTPGKQTIWDAAAATGSLLMIFAAAAITLPMIGVYTIYMYRVFRGKASALKYE